MISPVETPSIAAVILAAGRSSRMGQPKMNLAWGNTTMLDAVLDHLYLGGIQNAYIVINPLRRPLDPKPAKNLEVHLVENPDAEEDDMLVSLQTGLKYLPESIPYAMICLGDQPTIEASTVSTLCKTITEGDYPLVFPSYRMRRGHPWVVERRYFPEILALQKTDTVRTFIQAHSNDIHYVTIPSDPPVDMDTPEEYESYRPKAG